MPVAGDSAAWKVPSRQSRLSVIWPCTTVNHRTTGQKWLRVCVKTLPSSCDWWEMVIYQTEAETMDLYDKIMELAGRKPVYHEKQGASITSDRVPLTREPGRMSR